MAYHNLQLGSTRVNNNQSNKVFLTAQLYKMVLRPPKNCL